MPESIQPGEKWVEAIDRGLDSSGVFVVALTPAAIQSNWVRNETNAAIELEGCGDVQFIPLDVEPCAIPMLWQCLSTRLLPRAARDGVDALLGRLRKATTAVTETGDGETPPKVAVQTPPKVAVQTPPTRVARVEVVESALRLSGAQVQALMASLLDAFPSKATSR